LRGKDQRRLEMAAAVCPVPSADSLMYITVPISVRAFYVAAASRSRWRAAPCGGARVYSPALDHLFGRVSSPDLSRIVPHSTSCPSTKCLQSGASRWAKLDDQNGPRIRVANSYLRRNCRSGTVPVQHRRAECWLRRQAAVGANRGRCNSIPLCWSCVAVARKPYGRCLRR
jgi:hypothetical protein